jgi:hypothetical protein
VFGNCSFEDIICWFVAKCHQTLEKYCLIYSDESFFSFDGIFKPILNFLAVVLFFVISGQTRKKSFHIEKKYHLQ